MITKNAKTIMLAESSPLATLRIKETLESAGHRVLLTDSAEDMVKKLRIHQSIDLLLMDLHLNKANGIRLLEWMNLNISRQYPIICMTSQSEADQVNWKIKELGAEKAISKNLPPEALKDEINDVLFSYFKKSRFTKRRLTAIPAKFNLGAAIHDGNILNISDGGLFLRTTLNMMTGSKLKIDFTLPNKERTPVTTTGTVKWVTPKTQKESTFTGVGIAFAEGTDNSLLKSFVA